MLGQGAYATVFSANLPVSLVMETGLGEGILESGEVMASELVSAVQQSINFFISHGLASFCFLFSGAGRRRMQVAQVRF